MLRELVLVCALALVAAAQTDSDFQLLGRVRQHVVATLAGTENYTCRETMERSVYTPEGQQEFRERVRLDVLFTRDGELFAWPGSGEFTAESLNTWIRMGAIGNGNFATELHNLFIGPSAMIRYAGP